MPDIYTYWGTFKDLARCAEICQRLGYSNTKEQLRSVLVRRGMALLCAQVGDDIAGYCIYEACHDGLAVWQLRVDCKYQGQGVGRALVAKVKSRLKHKRTYIAVTIFVENELGEAFLRACGFRTRSFLRAKKTGESDRICMEYRLPKQGVEALT